MKDGKMKKLKKILSGGEYCKDKCMKCPKCEKAKAKKLSKVAKQIKQDAKKKKLFLAQSQEEEVFLSKSLLSIIKKQNRNSNR